MSGAISNYGPGAHSHAAVGLLRTISFTFVLSSLSRLKKAMESERRVTFPFQAECGIYIVSTCVYALYVGGGTVQMATAQIVKWGNSLAVRIPKPVAEEAGVREGDPIVIEVAAGGISLRRKQRIPTLKELVAKITPENRYEETPIGAESGKESVEW
jgi:antitoxin MazE